jgi:multimeric flavodoxin WrbA
MPPVKLEREEFEARMRQRFIDPAFDHLQTEIAAILGAAWQAYEAGRKAPRTRNAGPEFADPDYELSVDWLAAREAVRTAQARHDDSRLPARILLINGSARSEHTCPGEMSKSWRLLELAHEVFAANTEIECDILDLSRTASEFGRVIYPCKSCVATAMPLCHWPCSCYPNHGLQQVNDWMNEIYPMWVAARGVMIIAPVNWYHASSALKSMIDRLVCADGGNPDPTTTHGKHADEAKALELRGWPYPRHLAGRLFSVVMHGDVAGAETARRSIVDWLSDMGLVEAGNWASLDGYIGYVEPYATSHEALDRDRDFQEAVRNAARTLVEAVKLDRVGELPRPGDQLVDPRPK